MGHVTAQVGRRKGLIGDRVSGHADDPVGISLIQLLWSKTQGLRGKGSTKDQAFLGGVHSLTHHVRILLSKRIHFPGPHVIGRFVPVHTQATKLQLVECATRLDTSSVEVELGGLAITLEGSGRGGLQQMIKPGGQLELLDETTMEPPWVEVRVPIAEARHCLRSQHARIKGGPFNCSVPCIQLCRCQPGHWITRSRISL
jgi:hypothetical protein